MESRGSQRVETRASSGAEGVVEDVEALVRELDSLGPAPASHVIVSDDVLERIVEEHASSLGTKDKTQS